MLISTHQEHDALLFNLPTDFKLDSMRSGPATGDLLRRSRPHTVSEPHIPVLKEANVEYAKLQLLRESSSARRCAAWWQ